MMDATETLIRSMYADVKRSRELLLQVTTTENFENIFSPGEQRTIEELGKATRIKSEMLYSAVSSINVLKKKNN